MTIIVLLVILLLPFSSYGAEYYVSNAGLGGSCSPTAAGDISHPRCTIPQGLALLSPGDTLYVRQGTYTEQLTLNNTPIGNSSNWITIAGYQSERPILQGGGVHWWGWNGGHSGNVNAYLKMDNFLFDGVSFVAQDVNYVTLQNSELRGAPNYCVSDGATSGSPNHHLTYDRLHIHHCGRPIATTGFQEHGLYICTQDMILSNSDIHDNYGYAVHFFASGVSNCGDRARFYNNKIHHNTLEEGAGTIGQGNDMQFYNNLVYNNRHGIEIPGRENNDNYQIYNNTFYGNELEGLKIGAKLNDAISNLIVKNNLFQNTGTPINFLGTVTTPGLVMDHNMCATSDPNCDLTGSPGFEDPGNGNFALTAGSQAKNAGVSVALFNTDIIGTSRPQGGTWDIGAYEFPEGGIPPVAGDVYVDKNSIGGGCSDTMNSGTITSPFCTIIKGIQSVQAGKTVFIRQGTYNEDIEIKQNGLNIASGLSTTQRTTITGYQNETVTMTNRFSIFYGYSGENTTVKYITIKDMIFDGSYINTIGCYYPADTNCGPHFIRFQNLELKNYGRCPVQAGNGVTDIEYINLHIHDNGFLDTGPGTNCRHGMYIAAERMLLDGLHIHHHPGYGIQIYDEAPGCNTTLDCAKDTIIRNSDIHDNGTVVNGFGGITFSRAPNGKVYNNLIYNNAFHGLEVANATTSNALIANNTIMNNGRDGIQLNQLTNPTLTNNIVYGNATNNITLLSVTGGSYQKNLCNATGGACTEATANPLLNANFTLQAASPARNSGVTLSAFSLDKALVQRPQGPTWDIGAYEYVEGVTLPNPIYLSVGGYGDTPTDSGDCTVPETITTPRATLTAALACMQAPGKVLYIRGGTYPGKVNAWGGSMIGGSAASPTRIEGYQSEVVTIELGEDGVPALFFNGISYVTVTKLTFDAMNRPSTNGLACIGADHLKVLNSTFRKSYFEVGYLANCDSIEVTQSTFHTSAVSPVLSLEGSITNMTFDEVQVHTGPLQGIAANSGNGGNSSLSILRTQIHNTGLSGGVPLKAALDLGPGTGALLVNNIIDHNAAGIQIRSGASGTKVYHNAIASNTGVSIQCDSGASSVSISNNISFGNGTDSVVNNCSATLASNMATNPLWVNVASRDFHLQTTPTPSPALDQLSTILPEATIAIDGTQRPVGFLADLGPYEQTAVVPEPPPTTVLPLLTRYLGMWY